MSNNQVTIVRNNESKDGATGIKIVEWNVTDPSESTYAVVTPVKLQ